MIIGKLDADGWKIKEVDVLGMDPIFCEVCGKEVKGKSIGERTEYPIHEMTRFIFCSECKKKIRQDITDDLLQYERQKVIEWVRKKKDAELAAFRRCKNEKRTNIYKWRTDKKSNRNQPAATPEPMAENKR